MSLHKQSTAFILSFTLVVAIAFIYLLIAIALVPYWQSLSGSDLQSWWAGPFTRFSYLMVPVHLLSIISIIVAFSLHRNTTGTIKILWVIALITLLVCQGFNFTLHGSVYNLALQSGSLSDLEALAIFEDWDFYHTIRTISVCVSAFCLMLIGATNR